MRIEDLLRQAKPSFQIVDDRGAWTLEDLQRRAAWVRGTLLSRGLKPGGRVALMAENGADFVAGFFGILECGATAVLVDPGLPGRAVLRLLQATGAAFLCATGGRPERLLQERAPDFAPFWPLKIETAASARLAKEPLPHESPKETDAAVVLFSSGTSGRPKGVVLSHRALLRNVESIRGYLAPAAADRFYIAKSMVHSSTLTGEVLLAARCGSGMVALNPAATPRQHFRRIDLYRPTILCMPPSLLHFFVQAKSGRELLDSLRVIHVSGSIVNREDFREACRLFPSVRVVNGYGLTEAGPRVAQSGSASGFKPGSIGKPIQGVSLEVRRPDGSLCAAGEVGELHVRSESLMEGYLDGDGFIKADLKEGWLATGDLGYVDRDGDFFVVGRGDDMIICGSQNVAPADVEEVVLQVPGVQDCVVFGVEDALLGQRTVCAYSVDAVPKEAEASLLEAVRRACLENLASHQVPKSFCRWERIPRNPGGKALRGEARERFLAGGTRP